MIRGENIDASDINQGHIEEFLHSSSTLEFTEQEYREIEQVYLVNSINSPIVGIQSTEVPRDLCFIKSSDLIPVDPHLVQPPLDVTPKRKSIDLLDNVPVSNVPPKLEEHDQAGLNFELNLNSDNNSRNWYYSPMLRKVFIKLDKPFYIEVIYTPAIEIEPLYLRAMMVYVNNPFSPVQRCQNHLYTDQSPDNIKHNVLRCENTNVKYIGLPDGKSINDRLSILIPLGFEKPNEHKQIKHSVALKFVCQNSCIKREPTAVIFTLENNNSEVLGKKVVHVKVCSCPKRDKLNDENKYQLLKSREGEDMNDHPDKKRMKIKEEPDSSITSPAPSSPSEARTGVRITIDFPDIAIARDSVKAVFNTVAGRMVLNPKDSEKYITCCKDLEKLLKEYNKTNDRA